PRIRSGTTRWSPYDDSVHWAPPPMCATRTAPIANTSAGARPRSTYPTPNVASAPPIAPNRRRSCGPARDLPRNGPISAPTPRAAISSPRPISPAWNLPSARIGRSTSTPPATPHPNFTASSAGTRGSLRAYRTVSTVSCRRLGRSWTARSSANVAWIPRISSAESTNEGESPAIATADPTYPAPARRAPPAPPVRHRRHRRRLERGREPRGRSQQDVDQPGEILRPYDEETQDEDRPGEVAPDPEPPPV